MEMSITLRRQLERIIKRQCAEYCHQDAYKEALRFGKDLGNNFVDIGGDVFHFDTSFRDGPGVSYQGQRGEWDRRQRQVAREESKERITDAVEAFSKLSVAERKVFYGRIVGK